MGEAEFNPHFDLSPLRIAMEHMIYRQGMKFDQAALWFVLYAVGLVRDNMGEDRMRAILAQAIGELEKPAGDATIEH